MVIDADPQKRKWIELAGANPSLVSDFRPALVSFLAFTRSSLPKFAGTGYVIAGNAEGALVVTAKHVLQEGVLRAQKPESAAACTGIFVQASSITPSIDPKKLRAVWMGSKSAEMLKVVYVEYNNVLDIAVCWIMPEEKNSAQFEPRSVPLDIATPQVGDIVHMASLDRLKAYETKAPTSPKGEGQTLKIETRVSIRIGKVTGVYPNGLRQYRWPCFTTSIPAEPGMSGGLVTIPRELQTVGACGVICADNSSKIARKNQRKSGESIIALTWPVLILRVPTMSTDSAPRLSIYDMMLAGNIERALGDLTRVNIVDRGNDERTIDLRPE